MHSTLRHLKQASILSVAVVLAACGSGGGGGGAGGGISSSHDSALAALSVSEGSISPAFAPDTDPYVREFFSLLKTRPWCAYGGYADRPKLKHHLAQAALFALPSVEDNCPMVVLEAMAASVPMLAPRVGGLPDLIEHEVNGLFCDPLSAASMRSGVQRLLENPALAEKLAARARETALVRYHPEAIARFGFHGWLDFVVEFARQARAKERCLRHAVAEERKGARVEKRALVLV